MQSRFFRVPMSTALQRILRTSALALGLVAGSAMAQTAICYNCPPAWPDWAAQIRAIKAKTGVTVPPDNKNSGQALAQMTAEKASPVADVAYLGVTFAIQAAQDGLVAPYQPPGWQDIPGGPRGPPGRLVHDPLRHAGLHGQRRRPARQADSHFLGRPAQARLQGPH